MKITTMAGFIIVVKTVTVGKNYLILIWDWVKDSVKNVWTKRCIKMGNISEAIKQKFMQKVKFYQCLGMDPISAISAAQNDFKDIL